MDALCLPSARLLEAGAMRLLKTEGKDLHTKRGSISGKKRKTVPILKEVIKEEIK